MYYRQVKLDEPAALLLGQLREVVAKSHADPDAYLERLRQILNANSLMSTINNALRIVVDEEPRDADAIEDVIDAIEILANITDSDNKSEDWHDELDRAANHLMMHNVSEDDMEIGK